MADAFTYPADRYVLIGKIGKPHGLKGGVWLHLFSGQPESISDYGQLVLVSQGGKVSAPLRITSCRIQGKAAIVGFEGTEDRNSANDLKGMGVLVNKKDMPPVGEGEYYYFQFLGLSVTTVDGRSLGQVENIFFNGAQDILVIVKGSQEVLIPILPSVIVRQSDRELIISPPPGLVDINSGPPDDESY